MRSRDDDNARLQEKLQRIADSDGGGGGGDNEGGSRARSRSRSRSRDRGSRRRRWEFTVESQKCDNINLFVCV